MQTTETKNLTNLGRVLGAIGIVLLLSIPLTWLLIANSHLLMLIKLFLGSILLGIYLTTNRTVLERFVGARSTKLLAISTTSTLFVFGLVGAVNYLVYKHPRQFDLTREGIYTLSPQTINLLKNLKKPVKVFAFYTSDEPEFKETKNILNRYSSYGSNFSYELINPQNHPELNSKYQITERGPRLVVTAEAQEARVKLPQEAELTKAILQVTEQTSKTVYFLSGHHEVDLQDAEHAEGYHRLYEAIKGEGYTLETFSLQNKDLDKAPKALKLQDNAPTDTPKLQIPENISILVIAGAKTRFFPPEIDALSDFLKRGGRLIALLDPEVNTGLEALLKQYKILVHQDTIIDPNPLNRLLGLGITAPLIQPAKGHEITKGLREPVIMSTVRSLASDPTPAVSDSDIVNETLLTTNSSAWGETNLKGAKGVVEKDDHDIAGPLTVAIASRTTIKQDQPHKLSDEMRLTVFGDTDWLNNKFFNMQGNIDVFLNALNWTVSAPNKVTIRPKQRAGSQLFLSGEQLDQLKFLSLDLVPVLIVALGLSIVLIRRQK